MTANTLARALADAARFQAAAHALSQAHKAGTDDLYGSRLSGYVRRASMDLTRALADLRNSAK